MLPKNVSATIASGNSLSAAVNLAGNGLLGIRMPASWTAASLTFQISDDGTTYFDLYDEFGFEYTVVAAASRHIIIDPSKFVGVTYMKVRSGTSGSAVNQAADRALTLVARLLA